MRALFGLFLLALLSNSNAATCTQDTECNAACKTIQTGNSTAKNAEIAKELLSSETFDKMFPPNSQPTFRHKSYTHDELLKAISLFPKFCKTKDICRKHLSFLLAHARHETGCLRLVEENIKNANTLSYGGDCYKGRGLLQLTGKNNYKKFSQWYYEDGNGHCLLNNPEKVAEEKVAIWSGIWYFSKENMMNALEDDDFGETTKSINGVQECGCDTHGGCTSSTGYPDAKHMDSAKCRYKYFEFYASKFQKDEDWKKDIMSKSTDCTKAACGCGCEAIGCWLKTNVTNCPDPI